MKESSNKGPLSATALLLSLLLFSTQARCEDIILKELKNAPKPQGSYSLSLQGTIDLAVKNNRDIQIQQKEVDYARAGIVSAQSNFFPHLNIAYGFMYNDTILYGDSFPNKRKDTRIYTGYKSNNQITLSGTQMVYDGGASIAGLKQARVELKIQQETLRSMILQTEFEAKRLYYGLLLAYETLRITKYLLDQAQAHYENVKMKFEQGTSSKFMSCSQRYRSRCWYRNM